MLTVTKEAIISHLQETANEKMLFFWYAEALLEQSWRIQRDDVNA